MGEVGTANVAVELRLELVRRGRGGWGGSSRAICCSGVQIVGLVTVQARRKVGLAGIGLGFYYSYAEAVLMVAVPVLRRW
jgi:hypothetical protein